MSEGHEMQRSESDGSNVLGWFFTGAVIGATAAILFAPKSGKDTRRYIGEKAEAGRDVVVETSQDIVDTSREMFERGRKLVEDAADLFERGRRLVKG